MKRLLIILAVAIVAGVLTNFIYDYNCGPELSFFRKTLINTDQWEKDMRKFNQPCTIICGASETRMGVEPAIILKEYGIPFVNAGVAAGFGMRCNAAVAHKYLRPGDTLLFSLQSISERAVPPTTSGLKLTTLHLGTQTYSSGLLPLTLDNIKKTIMGSTSSLCTWMAKLIVSPNCIYKYDQNTIIHPSGWVEVLYREMGNNKPWLFNPPHLYPLPADGELMRFLHELSACCRERQVRLIIHIPVGFAHPTYQAQNAFTALQLIRQGYTVLRDERLGVISDPNAFSDMGAHLNGEASLENSRIIGRALKYNELWTEIELISLLRFMGWSAEGMRQPW